MTNNIPAQAIADWVAAQRGCEAPTVDAAIGYACEGSIAGVYFDCMTDNNIFAHVACVGPFPIALLRAVARQVYCEWGLSRMSFLVPSNDPKIIQFVVRLGAVLEAKMTAAFGAADGLLFVLWKTAAVPARLLRGSYGN